jgi:oxygen-independent coproporphyrinogen-3 oxidase
MHVSPNKPSSSPTSEPFDVDFERLEEVIPRYDASGPRYTSYPTAPSWNDDFGVEDYRAALQRTSERTSNEVALYAHVPFCRSLCHFCACNRVITKKEELPKRYLETIDKEIRAVRESIPSNPTTSQLHWGGGTPTHLSPDQIQTLFRSMTDAFPLSEGAEVSIEVDPRVTTQDQIDTLADCGFNRISMGVQDLDEKVQEAIHRIQPLEQTLFVADAARKRGMASVNLDLIYGLPFQTVDSFSHTLEQVLDISPDRIALYAYAHVAWKAKQQRSFDEKDLPDPTTRLRIMLMAIKRFIDAGYIYIGMDHFARPDDELCIARNERSLRRNFMGYTTQSGVDLLGFGPSAISELNDSYIQSSRDLPDWEARVEDTGFASMRGHLLSDDDQKRRWIIANLFCHGELRSQDYEAKFGGSFSTLYADELTRLEPMVADELVVIDSTGSITLTSVGRLLVRNVAMTFDAYLVEQQKSSQQLFSKTI